MIHNERTADFLTAAYQTTLWEYLRERVGTPWSTDLVCLGRVKNDRLVGVVGYNNFTGTSCYMHMAGDGPGWINRKLLVESFRYPFEKLGLAMVFGVVASGNIRALKMDLKLGFTELIFIPGAHPDGGIHVLQMRREQCRWLRNSDGQEIRS